MLWTMTGLVFQGSDCVMDFDLRIFDSTALRKESRSIAMQSAGLSANSSCPSIVKVLWVGVSIFVVVLVFSPVFLQVMSSLKRARALRNTIFESTYLSGVTRGLLHWR